MKRNYFKEAVLMFGSISVIAMSCKHDNPVDTNTPAYYISQSENTVIPGGIALPDNLPAGNSRVATFYAVGVQKYKAQEVPGSNPISYSWVFVAPQADLYDATNKKVGTHSAGPDWQLSPADSMFGQTFNPPHTAPSDDPSSVDWLLLMPKTGKTPTGVFADVDYVQRIDTKGGKAPIAPPANVTDTINVPYTAIYRFSKIN